MSLLADSSSKSTSGHRVERRTNNIIPLNLPREADRQGVVDWAMATVAVAEQQVALLQARVEYLESLSMTDELTGLLNRRGFLAQLDRALATARRGGPQGALVMCDLDSFKRINDEHGHLTGDEVLRQVGSMLASQVRRTDAVARLGGDEFAILLVAANLSAARRKAQALAQLVAALSFSRDACRVRLGISFGLAPYSGTETAEDLMNGADIAMYDQKRRNGTARA